MSRKGLVAACLEGSLDCAASDWWIKRRPKVEELAVRVKQRQEVWGVVEFKFKEKHPWTKRGQLDGGMNAENGVVDMVWRYRDRSRRGGRMAGWTGGEAGGGGGAIFAEREVLAVGCSADEV